MMEGRIKAVMESKNVSYLQLLRDVAISCDEFILFIRQKSADFTEDPESWPRSCGHIFSNFPILTPFGTCFTSHPNYSQATSSVGVTERTTILLSTHLSVVKRADWLQDEALRSGVQFSLAL